MSEDARREYEERLRRLAKKSTPEQLRAQDKIESEAARKELYTSESTTKESTVPDITAQELDKAEAFRRISPTRRGKSQSTAVPPSQRDVKTFDTVIQDLYEKSDFPTPEQQREAYLKAGPQGIDSVRFNPKTPDQAVVRVAYGVSEAIGGGIREATFGLTGSLGVENRPGGEVAQITGALLTPTVADMLFSEILTRTVKTVKGRRIVAKILNKVDDIADSMIDLKRGTRGMDEAVRQFPVGDEWANAADLRKLPSAKGKTSYDTAEMYARWMKTRETLNPQDLKHLKLTSDDIRILEKIRIGDAPSTSDMRNAKKVFNKLEAGFTKIDDPLGTLTEHELYYIRQEAKQLKIKDLNELLDKTSNPKEKLQIVVDFVTKNPELARTSEVITDIPLNQFDDAYEIRDVIDFTKENADLFVDGRILSTLIPSLSVKDAEKLLEETTNLSKTEIDNVIEQLRKAAPRTDLAETQVSDQIPEEEQGVITDQTPEQTLEQTPTPKQKTSQDTAQELAQELPQETVEETITEETLEPSPIIPFKLKTEKRRKLNLKLFNGPKIKYRVTLRYQDKTKQTRTVEARSHPEAIAKAEMGKNRSKTLKTVESERIQ